MSRTVFDHYCHARGCRKRVPPSMFMCKPHWFTLPSSYRASVWPNYVVGQEVRKDPTPAYLEAAEQAEQWLELHEREHGKVKGTQ